MNDEAKNTIRHTTAICSKTRSNWNAILIVSAQVLFADESYFALYHSPDGFRRSHRLVHRLFCEKSTCAEIFNRVRPAKTATGQTLSTASREEDFLPSIHQCCAYFWVRSDIDRHMTVIDVIFQGRGRRNFSQIDYCSTFEGCTSLIFAQKHTSLNLVATIFACFWKLYPYKKRCGLSTDRVW